MTTTIEQLKEYVEFLKTTDIEELELETVAGEKLHLKRSDVVPIAPVAPAPVAGNGNSKTIDESAAGEPVSKDRVLKSPLVGRFLRAPSEDHPPFVVEGSKVKQGQKVALIEAMRIRKDVVAQVAGTIKKIIAEDKQFVEYGQGLFVIEPEQEPSPAAEPK